MLRPRPLPPETIDALRPPAKSFPYFAHADHFRFDPTASEPSPVNAWWLADASLLVYGDAEFVTHSIESSPLPRLGFRLDWLGTPTDNRGLILTHDEAVVVVFRGTRVEPRTLYNAAEIVRINQDDLWTDTQFFPRAYRLGGRVHHGFFTAFSQISDRIDEVVGSMRPSQRLWLAGHSLGGALATLAAAHIGRDKIQGLYTYGSPRVGNAAFVSVLPDENHVRFVHRDDWVATVPPEFVGYVHGGQLHPVVGSRPRSFFADLANHADVLAAALAKMAREIRLKVGELPSAISSIADHAPIYYATLLWNTLLAETGGNDERAG